MVSVLRVEMRWSGRVRGLGFIARRCSKQGRKGYGRRIRSVTSMERKSVAGLGRKKMPDKWVHGVSDTQ
jgi:hypothetical protein